MSEFQHGFDYDSLEEAFGPQTLDDNYVSLRVLEETLQHQDILRVAKGGDGRVYLAALCESHDKKTVLLLPFATLIADKDRRPDVVGETSLEDETPDSGENTPAENKE